ncbi:hypothetical protein [Streptomyces sp. CB03911]|uniref:hypothetical protein n=1 Tax=Streptomyces sp. CB03911 TaxID=1804758 RepID=UPI00093FD376|nr:hypothetical protein [Streptomyces sp. CB03911]OKI29220.1 hypothetical protein A6A07_23895 [Streptomyces sp. CB03911]
MIDRIENLGTERVGQLTGSRDPEGRLLLNFTDSWDVQGVDLGANCEHDGRLYFFFGDVATTDNGEHRWQGWNFYLPNDRQGATAEAGQPDWRFCGRCHGLFWAPGADSAGTMCPIGGEHWVPPGSWGYVLPNDHQGATETTGQPNWRFCGNCHGLFWAPGGNPAGTVCPGGGEHDFPPGSWEFFLPNDHQGANDTTGQPDWRFCGKCHGLFWAGFGASVCPAGNPRNADLVAWTDDPTVAQPSPLGHQGAGFDFVLPNDHQGATETTGQPNWRFCGKCHGLFWAPGGNPAGTVCPGGGEHDFPPGSWEFFLPNDHQGANDTTGQPDWRFCGNCHGLFWAPGNTVADTVCPVNGAEHVFHPESLRFFLPHKEQGTTVGQPDWRFCVQCHGLFWAGAADTGACPVMRGGGIRLHPVLRATATEFDPLAGDWPVGLTKSLEAPSGAFSHNGRAHVFVNISPERWSEKQRPGDPPYGTYLISKENPEQPGPGRVEFLFSPRVGACPKDDDGGIRESHQALGYSFVLPHDTHDDVERQGNWRQCTQCAALFVSGDGNAGGLCWATGGTHRPSGFEYTLPLAPGTDGAQAKWQRCGQCASLFWAGDANGHRGRCRGGGGHRAVGPELALPHRIDVDNPGRVSKWRYCAKCAGLFWTGDYLVRAEDNVCPKDNAPHESAGLDFALDHDIAQEAHLQQNNWLHCRQCAGIFWDSDGAGQAGVCAKGGAHQVGSATATPSPRAYNFALRHDNPGDTRHQAGWRFCGKCTGLFWAGHPSGGVCPADRSGHQAGAGPAAPGFEFVLFHVGPGEDGHNESGWRFCNRCFELVWTGNADRLSGVSPVVVRTADHAFLPNGGDESTLVMPAFGFSPDTAFRLACMPLRPNDGPAVGETLYYAGRDDTSTVVWSPDDRAAADLFPHDGYTSLSASWQPGPGRWLLLYSNAHDGREDAFEHTAVARIARTPPEWADVDEVEVFDPSQAYGKYMHKPGLDNIDQRVPPRVPDGHKGWAYGLHLLDRYTRWSEVGRELDIYYLLSLSTPYQVQLMHTKLRITEG